MPAEAVERALAEAWEGTGVPGMVAMVYYPDGEALTVTHGRRSIDDPTLMSADSVFWIASFTKLLTSIIALQLVDEGGLSLDQPVVSLRPEFGELPILTGFDAGGEPQLEAATDAPTVWHLLTHTSGLGYPFMDRDLARFAERESFPADRGYLLPRRFLAGERWLYGASTDWLGAVIEAVCGESLDQVFQRRICGPLGMSDTTCVRSPQQLARAAAVHARLADGSCVKVDFAMPPPPNFNIGGGALYSTASDYMRLLSALLDGEILSDASRASLLENQIGDLQAGSIVSSNAALTRDFDPLPGQLKRWSLGMMINPAPVAGRRSSGSGAWAGLANCYYWLDTSAGIAGVLMTQILPFGDPQVLDLFETLERAVYAP
ncbi:MAG TPA: serine hydrolase domain-containing protein [Caulobacteraceae bacterium]|jgi:CubicO group peptidase (beta-lactamase class C family)